MWAKKEWVCFDVSCPKCGHDIPSPTGSLMWAVNEDNPKTVTCAVCHTELKVSK